MKTKQDSEVIDVEETALATRNGAVAALADLGTPDEMRTLLAHNKERLTIVDEYIQEEFREGIDFGMTDDRSSKKTLMKPGAEKVCRLFNTRPTWRRDEETWEMLGKPPGVVCYICEIINVATQNIVGEGRGAEKVGNKSRDANKAIKNAEKCALVDAALYTFGLSGRFTQDDGGVNGSRRDLGTEKRTLMERVGERRHGCNSSLSDVQFIIKVLEQELHKKQIGTLGEMDHVWKVLLTEEQYDWATGDKIPGNLGKQNGPPPEYV